MEFDQVLEKITALLQREGRLSYRAIKRRLGLDDGYLEDLKDELIYAKRLAEDEDGRVLVWTGGDQERGDTVSEPGQPTREPLPSQDEASQVESPSLVERRQLTVMFCDLVGSTALSEQLDPEELRELLRTYQAACHSVIRFFGGYIARYIGDGLLVYFGYPRAREDDAKRAVYTALGILKEMERRDLGLQPTSGVQLGVRIGIHTGLVVAGDMDEDHQLESMAIVGETPNVAARLQALAQPNTVVVSAATHGLIEGFFESRDLGAQVLKGISHPMGVYQIVRESGARTRLDATGAAGLTPLVGRESELSVLVDHWEHQTPAPYP